jgi:DNA-binding transcriptional MerR regulator
MKNHPNGAHRVSNGIWIDDEAAAYRPTCAFTDKTEFTIGELAREFGVTLRTLRFYENKGLIAPRRAGNARLYGQCDRSRIALILTGKKLGFTLAEIRTMIGAGETGDDETLRLSNEKCLEQIKLLEKQQANIKAALAELWRIRAGLSVEIARAATREPKLEATTTAPATCHTEA